MIKASEFDKKFDDDEDISEFVDWSSARKINLKLQRVNIDFPGWVVTKLDRESRRLGVSRQALVKMWIAERLERSPNT